METGKTRKAFSSNTFFQLLHLLLSLGSLRLIEVVNLQPTDKTSLPWLPTKITPPANMQNVGEAFCWLAEFLILKPFVWLDIYIYTVNISPQKLISLVFMNNFFHSLTYTFSFFSVQFLGQI